MTIQRGLKVSTNVQLLARKSSLGLDSYRIDPFFSFIIVWHDPLGSYIKSPSICNHFFLRRTLSDNFSGFSVFVCFRIVEFFYPEC